MNDKRSTINGQDAARSAEEGRARLRTLAEQQGVKPIGSVGDLRGDFWPPGEASDEFLVWLRNSRREQAVRSIPE